MAVSISISIVQNSQNVVNNTSNVTVTLKCSWTGGSHNGVVNAAGTPQAKGWLEIDGTKYEFANTFNWPGQTATGSQTLFTKTVNIAHANNGTKKLSCSASYSTYVSSGTVTATATKDLTVIPRKSTLSVGNGTLDKAQTLTVTRQSSNFTHTIEAACGDESIPVCEKDSRTSISFKPPIRWAMYNTTGTTVEVTYTITTYNGNASLGSNSYKKTCTMPASVKPECRIVISDATGYADTYGGYIQGVSKLRVSIDVAESWYSPVKSYKTTVAGLIYRTASFTTGILTSAGTLAIHTDVVDKRERSAVDDETVTVLEYFKPKVSSLSVHRCNADGTPNEVDGNNVKVNFSASIASLGGKNTANLRLEYKKTTETTYTSIDLIGELDLSGYEFQDITHIFEADSGSSYNVRVVATDNFDSGSKATTASTGFTIMHWLASGLGMAIGKISELAGVLDIGFKTRFVGGILHPMLEPETDLDEVLIPNTYIGADISTNHYTCGESELPMSTGTFSLEVIGMGENGQVKQRLTYCHRTNARAWERIYYGNKWGNWICVSDFGGKLLWDDVRYMTSDHVAELAEPISKQRSGIVLVFSRYSGGVAQDYHFQTFFVPKYEVAAHPGHGHTFMLTSDGSFGLFAAKYLYINDETIVGNDINGQQGTGACGITYTNDGFVLRHVIGV
jgi:hypothetical protein